MNRYDYRFETRRLEGTVVVAEESREAAAAKALSLLRKYDSGQTKIKLRKVSNSWPDTLRGVIYVYVRIKEKKQGNAK